MEASIIKIGNSKGLRLSKTILEKYNIKDKVELILEKGQIILMGGEAGKVSVSGTLDASGYGQGETGGIVHVLGEILSFDGNGLIDFSGDLGGGTLLFGGASLRGQYLEVGFGGVTVEAVDGN